MDEQTAAEGELRGFLAAFERLNNFTDHCATFSFVHLRDDSAIAVMDKAPSQSAPGLSASNDVGAWEAVARTALHKHLFEFTRPAWPSGRVPVTDALVVADEDEQRESVEWIIERVRLACAPNASWIVPDYGDDIVQDSVALSGPHGVFLLYLGFSD